VLTNAILNRKKRVPILMLEKWETGSCPKKGELANHRTNGSPWMRAQVPLRLKGLNKPGPVTLSDHYGFEYLDDPKSPTAIWFQGFETAETKINEVIHWLESAKFSSRS